MDFSWAPHFSMFWIFAPLCLIFMAGMMFMMFRGSVCGLMRFGHGTGSRIGNEGETPAQILDRRYAAGDITREQYSQMKQDMEINT